MNTIIIDKKDYTSYKDFYRDIFIKLDGKNNIDFEDMKALLYNANILNEFLWYCHNDNIYFIFKNFNLEKIRNYKNYENYQWNLIIEVIEDFVKKYSNNKLEFINDEKQN